MIRGWVPQALQFWGQFYEETLQLIINHRNQGGVNLGHTWRQKREGTEGRRFLMFEDVLLLTAPL